MPTFDNKKPSSLLFKIELAVLVVLLSGVGILAWRLAPEEVRASILSAPNKVVSYISNLIAKNNQLSSSGLAENSPAASPTPTPKPTIVPLPEGSQTYRFSNGSKVVGPKISSLTIDPLTPNQGDTQTVTLSAMHTSAITSVTIEVITDHKTEKHTLTQKSGTSVDGSWEGAWTMNDTFDYTYGLRLVLTSSEGIYDNTMWFRRSI